MTEELDLKNFFINGNGRDLQKRRHQKVDTFCDRIHGLWRGGWEGGGWGWGVESKISGII